jgi:arginase
MRSCAILEAPSILGLRPSGVETLPDALRREHLVERLHARHAGRVEPEHAFDAVRDSITLTLNAGGIAAFSHALADRVGAILDRGELPIVLGGDCSIVLGNLLALARRGRHGLFFVDGHADFYNPEANPNGEAASMDLALATGRGPDVLTTMDGYRPLVADADVVVFGFRDREEQAAYGSQPLPATIRAIDLDTIRRDGVGAAARAALGHLARDDGAPGFWIHLDADVLDDAIMPAVDYRQPGGLSWEELTTTLRLALASGRAVGLDVTIYNPRLDPDGAAARGLAGALVEALT